MTSTDSRRMNVPFCGQVLVTFRLLFCFSTNVVVIVRTRCYRDAQQIENYYPNYAASSFDYLNSGYFMGQVNQCLQTSKDFREKAVKN